jgi:hypothetical protein
VAIDGRREPRASGLKRGSAPLRFLYVQVRSLEISTTCSTKRAVVRRQLWVASATTALEITVGRDEYDPARFFYARLRSIPAIEIGYAGAIGRLKRRSMRVSRPHRDRRPPWRRWPTVAIGRTAPAVVLGSCA